MKATDITKRRGEMLEARMEAKGFTQTSFGERLGVSQATVSRWLSNGIPKSRYQDIAEALDMDVHALEAGNDGNYVLTAEDIERWRTHVLLWVDNVWVMTALVALPKLMRPSGEVYANPKAVSDLVSAISQERATEVWDLVLASPYVERVPEPVEWIFRLTLPQEN